LLCESLEARDVPSTISGVVYHDFDADGIRDASDTAFSGVTVYLDANQNSALDSGEVSTTSAANGTYSFNVADGIHSVALVVPTGYTPTGVQPRDVTVAGADVSGVDLGLAGLGPVGPETRVNQTTAGDQGYMSSVSGEGQVNSVAADAQGNYVVIWEGAGPGDSDGGVYARMYYADGTPRTNEFRVNLAAARPQRMPVIAMASNGDFAVAWSAWDAGLGRHAALARVFNANGSPRTGDIQVTAFGNKTTRLTTGIAMDADGDFVVLLQGADYSGWFSNSGIISFQRYNSLGQAQGKATQVVDAGVINGSSSVAMDALGNFVVVWGDSGIYAQRYNAAGKTVGARITTALSGHWPTVARNANGMFVVASNGDIQIFNADGSPRTGAVEFGQMDWGYRPALGIDAVGDVVVSWSDGERDVFARRFTSTGVAKEDAFRVNTTTLRDQWRPSLAMTPNGFVVVWQGQSESGDLDVFSQQFSNPISSTTAQLTTADS
jgi:hypothetical protein